MAWLCLAVDRLTADPQQQSSMTSWLYALSQLVGAKQPDVLLCMPVIGWLPG